MPNGGVRYVISTMPQSQGIFEYIHYYIWSMLEEEYGLDNCIRQAIPLSQLLRDVFIRYALMVTKTNEAEVFNMAVTEIYTLVHQAYPCVSFWHVEHMCQELFQYGPFRELIARVSAVFDKCIKNHIVTRFDVTVDHRNIVVTVRSERCA